MNKKIKTLFNILIVITLISNFILFILALGGGGVLNDLFRALNEIQTYEAALNAKAPALLSASSQYELDFFKSSAALKEYIIYTEHQVHYLEKLFFLSILVLILLMGARAYLWYTDRVKSKQR